MNNATKLTKLQLQLRRRIVEMTYESAETHLGSSLSVVDIIDSIYRVKKPYEKFILSNGHAACALYAVLERCKYISRASLRVLGVHPDRNDSIGIYASSGSLGQGLPIAVGMAFADKKKRVFCSISDGECAEGSIIEALRIAKENELSNLTVVVNVNGFSAYREIDIYRLKKIFDAIGWKVIKINGHNTKDLVKNLKTNHRLPTLIMAMTKVDQLPFLKGIDAHYHKISDDDYKLAMSIW